MVKYAVILSLLLTACILIVNAQKPAKIVKADVKPKVLEKPTPAPMADAKKEMNLERFGEKRIVTILYEALCPESERFMEQLGPVYEALKDYMQVEFVPYGLTKLACKRLIHGKCERPIFTCKHGPAGCKANRLHDCALQYSESPEKQMNFIMCSMGPNKVSAERCLELLNYPAHKIDICLTFEEGTELQLKSQAKTEPFKPESLPVVLFDMQYSEEIQNGALKDFRILACNLMAHKYQLINEESAPAICKTSDVFPTLN